MWPHLDKTGTAAETSSVVVGDYERVCAQFTLQFSRVTEAEICLLHKELLALLETLTDKRLGPDHPHAAAIQRFLADELPRLTVALTAVHKAYTALLTTGRYDPETREFRQLMTAHRTTVHFKAVTEIKPISYAVSFFGKFFTNFPTVSYTGIDCAAPAVATAMNVCLEAIACFTEAPVDFQVAASTSVNRVPLALGPGAQGAKLIPESNEKHNRARYAYVYTPPAPFKDFGMPIDTEPFIQQYKADYLRRTKRPDRRPDGVHQELYESNQKVASLGKQLHACQMKLTSWKGRAERAEARLMRQEIPHRKTAVTGATVEPR